jgi:cell division protein FtsW
LTATTVRRRITPPLPAEDAPRPEGPRRSRRETPRSRRETHAGRLKDRLPAPFHAVWIITLVLLVVGLCMMLSVSTAVTSGDKFSFVRNQGITAAFGIGLLLVLAFTDYTKLRKWFVVFVVLVIASLFVVHFPGVAKVEGGARSYIPIGPFTYQPSEFAKLAVVLLGAHVLTSPRVADREFWSFMVPFGALGLGMCGLVVWEHDLGTAIIIAGLMLGMLWIGGMRGAQCLLLGGVGGGAAAGLILFNGERVSRILSFLNPAVDPDDTSYQLTQSLVALGRGGLTGVGPGQSIQKYQYLPKARSDMIFAILGEEFGLIGAGLVIILFGALAVVTWRLASRCREPMGRLLIAGCGMLITLEAVVNIGGVTGALPLTGVPLPFISYGRNSLLVMLAAVGLILAVCRRASYMGAQAAGERYDNVTHLDRRRWDGRARGARAGAR